MALTVIYVMFIRVFGVKKVEQMISRGELSKTLRVEIDTRDKLRVALVRTFYFTRPTVFLAHADSEHFTH